MKNNWNHLVIKALAEEDDILNRNIGEPLWSQRYDEQDLSDLKFMMGERWFAALYQQKPFLDNSKYFKKENFRYFKDLGDSIQYDEKIINKNTLDSFATVDLAASVSEKSDYSVILMFYLTQNFDFLIFDLVRERIPLNSQANTIRNYNSRYKFKTIGIESINFQNFLVLDLKDLHNIKGLLPKFKKEIRASNFTTYFEMGKVYFMENAPFLKILEKELIEFPDGDHDDIVDAVSYMAECVTTNSINETLSAKINRKSDYYMY